MKDIELIALTCSKFSYLKEAFNSLKKLESKDFFKK